MQCQHVPIKPTGLSTQSYMGFHVSSTDGRYPQPQLSSTLFGGTLVPIIE